MTVPEKKMNAGVELLLKRMETHPEEFNGLHPDGSKWFRLITSYRQHLDGVGIDALDAGIDKIMQQQFTEKVLEGLVDPKPSTSLKELLDLKQQNATLGATQTPSPYLVSSGSTGKVTIPNGSITLGQTTLDEQTLEHMKSHIEAIRKQKMKAHNTIYGKLKNYLGAD